MPRSWMNGGRAAAGLALAWFCAISPALAEGRRWISDSTDEAVTLIYGTPESDDMLLSLVCEKAKKTMILWYVPQPIPVKAPSELPITISSEAGGMQLTAAGTHSDEIDSYSLEAQTPLTPELAKLLTAGKTLTIKAEKTTANLPLDDVALKGAEELTAACRK